MVPLGALTKAKFLVLEWEAWIDGQNMKIGKFWRMTAIKIIMQLKYCFVEMRQALYRPVCQAPGVDFTHRSCFLPMSSLFSSLGILTNGKMKGINISKVKFAM